MSPQTTIATQVETALLHDARCVDDIGGLRFSDYGTDKLAWAVITLNPGARSGSMTIDGAFIRAETGEIVTPTGTSSKIIKEGDWTRREVFGFSLPEKGQFTWTDKADKRKRVIESEDIYSPFVSGGTIVFHPVPGKSGIEQFGAIRLIQPVLIPAVATAFLSGHAEEALQVETEEPRDGATLLKLLAFDNVFVQAVAFRRLIASGQMTGAIVFEQVTRSKDILRAVLCSLVVQAESKDPNESLLNALSQAVAASIERANVEPIALGAYSAKIFHQGNQKWLARCNRILTQANAKVAELGVRISKDSSLALMFRDLEP